jgi:ribonuclease E
MKKEMLINVLQPEECRIAIIEDGILEELYVERTSHESYTGNIYKGKIVNLEPAIQAAFVDFSVGRNGFLHVSDVEPQYFDRHVGEPFEPDAAPRERGRDRDRDRDRDREPRRGRGRGRDDRRRAPAADAGEAPPPRHSERPRDRDRGRDEPRERDRERGRERERPDQSIRGRRDRSQPPMRRFGEGLVDPQDRGPEPSDFGETSLEPVPAPFEDQPAPRTVDVEPPAPEPFGRSERSGPAVASDDVRRRRPQRARREFGQGVEPSAFTHLEGEGPDLAGEPSDRIGPNPDLLNQTVDREDEHAILWSEAVDQVTETREPEIHEDEPFDADLPPSRTDRTRTASRPPREPKVPEQTGRRVPHPLPPEEESAPVTEERPAEPEIEIPAARESRRPRNRNRPSSPSGRSRPMPPPEEEAALDVEAAPDTTPQGTRPLPGFDEPSPLDEPPRRRGGRAAIRARGGESERARDLPAPADYIPERELPRQRSFDETEAGRAMPQRPDIEERRALDPSESRREPDRERDRDRDRDRGRRPAHGRAGEPGYVPRRERLHSGDLPFGAEIFSPESTWPQREAESEMEAETELTLGRFADEPDVEFGPQRVIGEPPGAGKSEPRRRRRRRGRRRERERGPASFEAPPSGEGEPEFDEYADIETRRPEGRSFVSAGGSLDEVDELDLEEAELDRDLLDEDDFVGQRGPKEAPAAFEEEIDAELEQEIRKEIEEIEELEREMGLRGSPESAGRPADEFGRGGRTARGRGLVKPPIQEIFRRGDEVLVQVIKESIGTKGPTLSTYISIPGRYLVLMPGLNRVGVSRKIVDEGQRRKLREIMHELNPPRGLGFIVRTAGLERTKRELARDLAYLLRLWKVILRRIKKSRAPTPIYQESDMIIRTIRDIFTSEIDTIWIDEPSAFERAQDFLRVVMPRFVNRLKLYDEKVPLFHKYGIEDEIAKIQRRHVPLPEGGSIVIDPTEALVAIDVNSGNFRVEDDAEKTAYEMNLRAAKEIARQLRLRDLGGVIVNDFIDMREERHRRGVERALREAIRRDRARTKVLRMSAFGLIEMTRQRIRPSLKRSIYEDCPHCSGAGVVKTPESMAIDVMRLLALATHREEIRRVVISVSPGVATYLSNRKRKEIARFEQECQMAIQIGFQESFAAEHLQIECFDANGNEVRLHPAPPPAHRRGH